jgi:hypothetical protein
MWTGIIVGELARFAARNLRSVTMADVTRFVRELRPAPVLLLGPTVAALGAGIAIGTTIGVLIAPRAGSETRKAAAEAMRKRWSSRKAGNGAGTDEGQPLDPHSTHQEGETQASA